MVRLAGFEPATFGSGDRRSNPAELQAHFPIGYNYTADSRRASKSHIRRQDSAVKYPCNHIVYI
jgi:hypothetical protein